MGISSPAYAQAGGFTVAKIRPHSIFRFVITPTTVLPGQLFYQSLTVGRTYVNFTNVLSGGPTSNVGTAPIVTKSPFFYPSPFKLSTGSLLGYELDRDGDVEIRIFNMRADEVFRQFYPSGTVPGGAAGYNKVPFDATILGHNQLPSGPYFFVLMNAGQVIAKGKFLLLP